MKKMLIIEDDPAISKGLVEFFTSEQYSVRLEEDGDKGYNRAKGEAFDIILLDIMLPGKDGMDICRDLRKGGSNVPILMLTSKKEEIDKIMGLEFGADDYVTKPFSVRELSARIKALLRRASEIKTDIEEFSLDHLFIDFKRQEMRKNKKVIELSTMECKVLKFFIEHEGTVISRETLLDKVWGYENYPTTRTVDNFILSLRKLVEKDPADPKHFITIHGTGYKFVK